MQDMVWLKIRHPAGETLGIGQIEGSAIELRGWVLDHIKAQQFVTPVQEHGRQMAAHETVDPGDQSAPRPAQGSTVARPSRRARQ